MTDNPNNEPNSVEQTGGRTFSALHDSQPTEETARLARLACASDDGKPFNEVVWYNNVVEGSGSNESSVTAVFNGYCEPSLLATFDRGDESYDREGATVELFFSSAQGISLTAVDYGVRINFVTNDGAGLMLGEALFWLSLHLLKRPAAAAALLNDEE